MLIIDLYQRQILHEYKCISITWIKTI